jgi:hypothetical protein
MRALVVFVEGAADAFYVMRCLGQLEEYKYYEGNARALPTPFGADAQTRDGLVLNWNQRIAPDTRTLPQSAEDYEPVFQVAAKLPQSGQASSKPDWVLVVRMGGDRKAGEVTRLLDQLKTIFAVPLRCAIKQIACAFVFDADTPAHYQQTTGDCVQLREQCFAESYRNALAGAMPPTHTGWTTRDTSIGFPLGLFVLHNGTTRCGTLEHLVEPALNEDPVWARRLQAAERLLDDTLLKDQEQNGDLVPEKESDRQKARITIGGQWRKPGESLAQILRKGRDQVPCVPDAVFRSSDAKALVDFLLSAPWA